MIGNIVYVVTIPKLTPSPLPQTPPPPQTKKKTGHFPVNIIYKNWLIIYMSQCRKLEILYEKTAVLWNEKQSISFEKIKSRFKYIVV